MLSAGAAPMALSAPFGNEADVQDAKALWQVLKEERLVGPEMIHSTPYGGQHPHGAVLETLDTPVTVDGHTGEVIVKRNYGGSGVSKEAVANQPQEYLKAITVMFKREQGYDEENQNWFWAKYLPDGSLDKNPKNMPLAGRVAKGASVGCIACHQAAPGDDYVYNFDRIR